MTETTAVSSDFTLGFQIKYCLLTFTCITASQLYIYNHYLFQGLADGYFKALVTLAQLEDSLAIILLITFFIQTLLILLCSLFLIIFFKRKIVGVIYRFERLLREVNSGNLQHIAQNRDNDQIKALFSALNTLTISLRTIYSSLHGVEKRLHNFIRQKRLDKNPDLKMIREQIAQARILLGCNKSAEGD